MKIFYCISYTWTIKCLLFLRANRRIRDRVRLMLWISYRIFLFIMRSGFALLNASWREVYHIASSETQGQSVGSGEKAGRKFLLRAKEPLGTDSQRTISKNSSGCRLLIGHKKCFVLLCPIGEHISISSFRVFLHDGYCLDPRSQETFSLI